jgi:hypothetical protein
MIRRQDLDLVAFAGFSRAFRRRRELDLAEDVVVGR